MTTEEATQFLAKKGIKVQKIAKNKYRVWDLAGNVWDSGSDRWFNDSLLWKIKEKEYFWSGRAIIKLARSQADSTQQPPLHKNVKKFSNDKDRTATRDALRKEDFEALPPKSRAKRDNIWNWD